MKYMIIHLGENKIEFSNSFTGTETVTVNGKEVSSKFSITGTKHLFEIQENGKYIACKLITGVGLGGTPINLYKDNKPIVESLTMSRDLRYFFLIMLLIFIIDHIFTIFS